MLNATCEEASLFATSTSAFLQQFWSAPLHLSARGQPVAENRNPFLGELLLPLSEVELGKLCWS